MAMRGVVRDLVGVFRVKGGAGSGHRGHSGRPGSVGGSLPGIGGVPFTPMGKVKAMEHARRLVKVVGRDGVTLSDPTDKHLQKYAKVFAKQDERALAAVDEIHVAEDKYAWRATLKVYNEAFDETMTPSNVYAFYARRTGAVGETVGPHGLKNVMEFPHRVSEVQIGHEIGHAAYYAASESAQANWATYNKTTKWLGGNPKEQFADMYTFYAKYRGKPNLESRYIYRDPEVYEAVHKVLETMK